MNPQLEAILKDDRFWALERRIEIVWGDWLPGKDAGREIKERIVWYTLRWFAGEGRVWCVKARTLDELPAKLASGDWM